MAGISKQDKNASAGDVRLFGAETKLRLWPALLIAALQMLLAVLFSRFGSTIVQDVIAFEVVPGAATILLVIWWLALSRAPLRDRLMGFALWIAALLCIVFTQKNPMLGAALLVFALPAMTTCIAALLAVTSRVPWRVRRWTVVAWMLLCAAEIGRAHV